MKEQELREVDSLFEEAMSYASVKRRAESETFLKEYETASPQEKKNMIARQVYIRGLELKQYEGLDQVQPDQERLAEQFKDDYVVDQDTLLPKDDVLMRDSDTDGYLEEIYNDIVDNIKDPKEVLVLLNMDIMDPVLYPSLHPMINKSYSEGGYTMIKDYYKQVDDMITDVDDEHSFMSVFGDAGLEFKEENFEQWMDRMNLQIEEEEKEALEAEDEEPEAGEAEDEELDAGEAGIEPSEDEMELDAEKVQKEREDILNDDSDAIPFEEPDLNSLLQDYDGPGFRQDENVNEEPNLPEQNAPVQEKSNEEIRAEIDRDIHKKNQLEALRVLQDMYPISSAALKVDELQRNLKIFGEISEEYKKIVENGPDPKYAYLEGLDTEGLKAADPWKDKYPLAPEKDAEPKEKEDGVEIRENYIFGDQIVKEEPKEEKIEEIKVEEIKEEEKEDIKEEKKEEEKNIKIEEPEDDGLEILNINAERPDLAKDPLSNKEPKAKPRRISDLTPEEFFSNQNAYISCSKSTRVNMMKKYLIDRAMKVYDYKAPIGYDTADCYDKYLSNNEVGMQIIEDMAGKISAKEALRIMNGKDIMKVCFDRFDPNVKEHTDEARVENAEPIYYGRNPENKSMLSKSKERFFSGLLNPSITVGQMQQICKDKLTDAKERPFNINYDNASKAADLVFADLMTRNRATMDGGYFGKTADQLIRPRQSWTIDNHEFTLNEQPKGKNDLTLKEHNAKMQKMRERMMNDEVFKKVLKQGGTSEDFLARYKKEWNRKMEFSAGKENVLVRNRAIDDKALTITDEEKQFFKDLYKNMQTYNNNKVRKGVNEDMMNALKNVNDKAAAGDLKVWDMKVLNYASAHYYMSRKGTFMEPVTQAGKDRLSASAAIQKMANSVLDDFDKKLQTEGIKKDEQIYKKNNPVNALKMKK
ncbi:MAG: hypothetical protein K6E18_10810 [Lachnospiraceae bacterium]|nr:hypothetical protein [Lachnospiraceae bacterium]